MRNVYCMPCKSVLVIGFVLLLIAGWLGTAVADVEQLAARKAWQLIQAHRGSEAFVILDIRTPGEYAQGHIAGAVLLDYYGAQYVERLKRLDKSKQYFIYCRSGNRSGRTLKLVETMGFQKIYHLQSGIIDWVRQKLPLVKSS